MKLITTYESGINRSTKAMIFMYKYIHILTRYLYRSPIPIDQSDIWIQKGSITKTGKPNEIS